MKIIRCIPTMLTALLATTAAAAEWEPLLGTTTADLAAAGWDIQTSSGWSSPDGELAVVTYWTNMFRTPFTIRCVTTFSSFGGQEMSNLCKGPSTREIPGWMLSPLVD